MIWYDNYVKMIIALKEYTVGVFADPRTVVNVAMRGPNITGIATCAPPEILSLSEMALTRDRSG